MKAEQRLDERLDALSLIISVMASYDSPSRLRRRSATDYGLDSPGEAIEMAYENLLEEAKAASRVMKKIQASRNRLIKESSNG